MNRRAFLTALLAVPAALRVLPALPRPAPKPDLHFQWTEAQRRLFVHDGARSLILDSHFRRGNQWLHYDRGRQIWFDPSRAPVKMSRPAEWV